MAFPLREHLDLEDAEVARRVAVLLDRVGLAGTGALAPAELSGGMRKRVALARGLALDPEVILYDEPTAGLDPLTGLAIAALIGEVTRTTGATSLLVTHDIAVAAKLADRVAFLSKGGSPSRGRLRRRRGRRVTWASSCAQEASMLEADRHRRLRVGLFTA